MSGVFFQVKSDETLTLAVLGKHLYFTVSFFRSHWRKINVILALLSKTLYFNVSLFKSHKRKITVFFYNVPVLVLLFVALWFILRGDLLYVFPCVILFLCFSVLLVLRLPRWGKRELILVLFVRLFGLCLFRFVDFLFLLESGKGCGL